MTRHSTRLRFNALTIEEIALDLKDTLNVLNQNGTHEAQPFRDAIEEIEVAIIHINVASQILRRINR